MENSLQAKSKEEGALELVVVRFPGVSVLHFAMSKCWEGLCATESAVLAGVRSLGFLLAAWMISFVIMKS